MGAYRNRGNFSDANDDPTTLCEWVRSFRVKRSQMKRRLRGNLRINAMLNTALENAEAKLRRKQKERYCRWTVFQAKLDKDYGIGSFMQDNLLKNLEKEAEQQETIDDLWKSELSELDTFMRSLSSSSTNKNFNSENNESLNGYQNDSTSKSDNCNALQPSIPVYS